MSVVTPVQAWDVVAHAVETVLTVPAAELTSRTSLVDDLGADSLALIELVEVSEEQLRAAGISVWVDDDTLSRLTLLEDLVSALLAAKEK
jgi:acyl carrier protein